MTEMDVSTDRVLVESRQRCGQPAIGHVYLGVCGHSCAQVARVDR